MKLRSGYILLFALFASISAHAQTYISGMVVDSATFEALPNVNIQIKGKTRGTVSDVQGKFTIQATYNDTLIFSFVGYNKLEFPLYGYETGLITLSQRETVLSTITISDDRIYTNPYQGLFDEQNARLRKSIPFYYSKGRKDKIKAANWREESLRVQTYIDVVINNPSTKEDLMKKFKLNEKQYYEVLTAFNEKHNQVMYYLTAGELLSLLNRFFELTPPTSR
jgi:hypothetical protein